MAARILDGLTPDQQAAVTHGEGPLLLIAGAGTGKTSVITRRIAYLVASKIVQPSQILALTYTEKAATAMEERVDVLVPYGYTDISISTFHAFGDRVLRDHALELGLDPRFKVLTTAEQILFLRERLFELPLKRFRPLGDPTKYLGALLTLISRAKDEDVSPEEYLEHARAMIASAEAAGNEAALDEADKHLELAQAYQVYQTLMAQHGFADFGDQLYLTLRLLRERPALRAEYQARYRYILVDEFQDTNYAQFQMVKLLGAAHRNVTVVGDDDQSIYRFRGAALSNILNFTREFPDAAQLVLTANFRSPQTVLDASYRLITHNNPDRLEVRNRIDKRLRATYYPGSEECRREGRRPTYYLNIEECHREGRRPQTDSGPPVLHFHYNTLSEEADAVADHVARRVAEEGIGYGDCAILVRSNKDADPFLRAMNLKGIPYRFSGNQGLYSLPEIRLLIALVSVVADPEDNVNFWFLASSEIYGMDALDLSRITNLADRRHRSLFDLMEHLAEVPELSLVSEDGRVRAARLVRDVKAYAQASLTLSVGKVLYAFLTDTGYLKDLCKVGTAEADQKLQNIAKFFSLAARFEEVGLIDRVPQFVTHLSLLREAGDDPAVAEADPDDQAVHVLTVHKAKGLEFPVVFMVGLVKGRFPTADRSDSLDLPHALVKEVLPEGDRHMEEERRLFYVGMTRAQRSLILTSARDVGGLRVRKVSPFVVEALDLPTADPAVVKASAAEHIERFAPVEAAAAEAAAVPADEIIRISHRQVDDYQTCPLKYKYMHVMRIPLLPHHRLIYGAALHGAIEAFHKRAMQGQPMETTELLETFKNLWKSDGFLTRAHEEQRFDAGVRALTQFVERSAGQPLPASVEGEFSFFLGPNRVVGRWDRLDQTPEGAIIIDYKSSDVRSQKDADKKAKDSLQLEIYAMAYRARQGVLPVRMELYYLESGIVGAARPDEKGLGKAEESILQAAAGIRARSYPAKPGYLNCHYCPYREICPSSSARK